MNRLEEESFALSYNGNRLEPVSLEKNVIGFCSKCDEELVSIAYHRSENDWLVSARCNSKHLLLIHYDAEWNWIRDLEFEMAPVFKSITSLPREMLQAIFTPAEIRTLEACEKGEPFTRQNLYRARAKYENFERLFGVKLNL